jgi:hypothetical protein
MILTLALGLPVMMTLSVAARAEGSSVNVIEGYAIGGYDAVMYVTESRAVRGSTDHALMWRGATWLFANAETMMAFEMNPKVYAPRFGGYCAYNMSRGVRVAGDPEVFEVHDGRVYLYQDAPTRDAWLGDAETSLERAELAWTSAGN